MPHLRHLNWVYTVCKSLSVSILKVITVFEMIAKIVTGYLTWSYDSGYDNFAVFLQEKFEVFVNASAEVSKDSASILDLWKKVKTRLYSLDDRHKELGLGKKVSLLQVNYMYNK